MDVDFTLEDDVEMVSRFVFAEDDCPVGRDAFTAVGGKPVIFVFRKVLEAFDVAQRGDDLEYGCRMHRGGCTYFAATFGRRYRASSVGLVRKCRSHVLSYSLRECSS
jgi:hypothetical protein